MSESKLHRVVIETDKAFYLRLKSKLVAQGMTVRAWFERQARAELGDDKPKRKK